MKQYHLKVIGIYAEKEAKAIKGELLEGLVTDYDNQFLMYESKIPPKQNVFIRNAFLINDFNKLFDLLKNYPEDALTSYYEKLITLSKKPAEYLIKENPFPKTEEVVLHAQFLFDAARVKLFKGETEDAKSILNHGFYHSSKDYDDFWVSFRLFSMAFEQSGDLEGAYFFMKTYLEHRTLAIEYLNDKFIELATAYVKNDVKESKHKVKVLIETLGILGPEFGKKLLSYINNHRVLFEKTYSELPLRMARIEQNFSMSESFDTGEDFSYVYDFLTKKGMKTPAIHN